MHPALRRVAQFFRATFARVRAVEYELIRECLAPAQAALFFRMVRSDQRHCLDVYYTLIRAGCQDEDLLRAALLHDVGKSASDRWRMTVFHRVAIVLLQSFTFRTFSMRSFGTRDIGERWLARLAADGRGWKAPFAVHVRHAQTGAERAADAGCSPAIVSLIREHHGGGTAANADRLAALQWADEQN